MKKNRIGAILLALILAVSIIGCSKANISNSGNTNNSSKNTSQNELDSSWDEILKEAKGKTVNIHMWGGDNLVNRYIDEWVKPNVKEKYFIDINRVPVTDPRDIINKLLTEKQAGKETGTIDIMWINGENFKLAKDNELLFGSFASKIPNYEKYIDKDAKDIKYDFGEETEDMEVPWGKSQFVMVYDSAKIENPPKNMEELKSWIKENPGKFSYPAPPDFTGSAFIRHVLHAKADNYDKYLQDGNMDSLEDDTSKMWEYLNEIKPNLWRNGESYPESSIKLDQLYSTGEVYMSMSYNPIHALNKIKDGQFPETTRTFIFEDGTLSNTHYLTIPYSSQNKSTAMALINFMISPEAQIAKYDPEYWGDGIALSMHKLSDEDKEKIEKVDLGDAALPLEVISQKRIPEILAKYLEAIEEGWVQNVAK